VPLADVLAEWDKIDQGGTDLAGIRALCLEDRFYLLVKALRRYDALHPWVYARCREVEKRPDDCLDLWAREHYKSTVITFAGVIQEILRDPEITVCIFSHTKGIARKFFRQIKLEFESNDVLKRAFPDILWADPHKEAPRWAEETGLVVKRKCNPKESTLEAWGLVDGQPTSAHYRLRVYDDVVAPESVTTPDQVQKTTAAWELSDNLGMVGGRKWHVGTRYSFADTYQSILERKALKARIYPATDTGHPDGNPVLLSKEQWEEKKVIQGPATIACHCAGTTVLMADWTYRAIEDVQVGDEVVGFVPGVGKGQKMLLKKTKVLATNKRRALAREYSLESGAVVRCTPDHKWATLRSGLDGHSPYAALGDLGKRDLRTLHRIANDHVAEDRPEWQYLAGILDGEGTVSGGRVVITQSHEHNPEVVARIRQTLDTLELDYSTYSRPGTERKKASTLFLINGGRHERHRILLNARPAKRAALIESMYCRIGGKAKSESDRVTGWTELGEQDVFNIQTETGNYIANGYASKNCQMLQNPLAGQQAMFNALDIVRWEVRPATLNVYILVDPARSMKKGSANTAMAVIGVDAGRNKYLLDGFNHRMDLKKRWENVRELRRKWIQQPGVQGVYVGYEAYGAQADLDYFNEQMVIENNSFPIEELKWPRDTEPSKDDRVQRLGPDFRAHKFYLPALILQQGKPCFWNLKAGAAGGLELHYNEMTQPTALMARVIKEGSPFRVAKPIRQVDSEGNLYDLSRHFIEQQMLYPFAPLKDLVDAASRIYDLNPVPPVLIDESETMPEVYADGI